MLHLQVNTFFKYWLNTRDYYHNTCKYWAGEYIPCLLYTLYSHFAFNWLWANPVTSMLCKPSFYDLRHQIDFTSQSSNFLLKIYYLWEKESQILFYPNTTSVLHSTYHYHFLSKERYHLPIYIFYRVFSLKNVQIKWLFYWNHTFFSDFFQDDSFEKKSGKNVWFQYISVFSFSNFIWTFFNQNTL